MNEPLMILRVCWAAQLPLMLATTVIWMMHGIRIGTLEQWLREDHHGIWHWTLGFSTPVLMSIAVTFGWQGSGFLLIALISSFWPLALAIDMVREWRRVPGPPYRFMMSLQTAVATLGGWAAWQHVAVSA
jgi:hypothetical protein